MHLLSFLYFDFVGTSRKSLQSLGDFGYGKLGSLQSLGDFGYGKLGSLQSLGDFGYGELLPTLPPVPSLGRMLTLQLWHLDRYGESAGVQWQAYEVKG